MFIYISSNDRLLSRLSGQPYLPKGQTHVGCKYGKSGLRRPEFDLQTQVGCKNGKSGLRRHEFDLQKCLRFEHDLKAHLKLYFTFKLSNRSFYLFFLH